MALKITMLVIAGLLLGLVGGGAAGIGISIVWTELIQSTQQIGGTVLSEVVPFSAIIGAIGGGALFAVIAIRDTELQIERPLNERE
jgi:hypothetical protein